MARERIVSSMTSREMLMAMSGGNPGALTVCLQLLEYGSRIDPDSFAGGLTGILALDHLGIYEARIWMFYKDVCDCNLVKMVAALRANQLGQLAGASTEALHHAIEHRGEGLDLDAVLQAVKGRLPRFGLEGATA